MAARSDEQILIRIGFAERWLQRARRYYSEGNPGRSVLTLALADAEMRRALEAAGLAPRTAARVPAAALAALAGVMVAALAWVFASGPSVPAAATAGPPAVRLTGSSGTLLMSLSLSAPAPAPPAPSATVAVRRRPAAPPAAVLPARTPAAPAPASPAPSPPAPEVARPPAAAPDASDSLLTPSLSVDELVELILAADRTLRREPVTP